MGFPQTPIILDTFTDTNGTALTSHTGDSGQTWAANSAGFNTGTAATISNNQGLMAAGFNGFYYTNTQQATTDFSIQVDVAQSSSATGVGLGFTASSDISQAGYEAICYANNWQIYRSSGGSFGSMGSVGVGGEFLTTNTFADMCNLRFVRRANAGVAMLNFLVNGCLVLTATDGSPFNTKYGGVYGNSEELGSNCGFDNFKIFNASQEIGLLMIGDSITAGYVYNGSTTQVAPYPNIWIGNALCKGKKGLPVYVSNYGYTSTTSTDWVNGTNGANLTGGIASLSSQSIRVASIMLGVNDSKTATRISIAQHAANIASIIATLKAAGFVAIFLHMPTYTASGSFGAWDNLAAIQYMPGYREAQMTLVDNRTVFLGDTQGGDMLAANVSGDGIHPTPQMSRILFQSHANVMAPVLQGLVGGQTTLVSSF